MNAPHIASGFVEMVRTTTAARTGVDFGVFMARILEYIPAGKSVKPEDIAVGGPRA